MKAYTYVSEGKFELTEKQKPFLCMNEMPLLR